MQYTITRHNAWYIDDAEDFDETPDITSHQFNLLVDADDDSELAPFESEDTPLVGSLSAFVINTESENLWEQMDSLTGELESLYSHLHHFTEAGALVVSITDVKIDESHRGKNLANQLISTVIHILSKEIGTPFTVVITPYPTVEFPFTETKDEKQARHEEIDKGIIKLKKYYANSGFKVLKENSTYMYLNVN